MLPSVNTHFHFMLEVRANFGRGGAQLMRYNGEFTGNTVPRLPTLLDGDIPH